MTTRKKDLILVLEQLSKEVLCEVRPVFTQHPRVESRDTVIVVFPEEPQLDYGAWLRLNKNCIQDIPSFKKAVDLLRKYDYEGGLSPHDLVIEFLTELLERLCPFQAEIITPALPEKVPPGVSFDEIIARKVVQSRNPKPWDPKIFRQLVDELHSYLMAKTISWRISLPLIGLEMDVPSIRIDDILIERTTDQFLTKLLTPCYFTYNKYQAERIIHQTKFVMSYSCTIPKSKQPGDTLYGCQDKLERFITSLELFKDGSLRWSVPIYETTSWIPWPYGIGSSPNPSPLVLSIGAPDLGYELKEEEMDSLTIFWNLIRDPIKTVWKLVPNPFKKRDGIEIALQRFKWHREMARPWRILDTMIGLESLYRAKSSSELGQLCAVFLGQNDLERTRIRKLIGTGYYIRNKIVHGGQMEPKYQIGTEYMEIDEITDSVQSLLRRSLKDFLCLRGKMWSFKKIRSKIDQDTKSYWFHRK